MDAIANPILLYAACGLGAVGVVLALPRRGVSPRALGVIVAAVAVGGVFLALGVRSGGKLPGWLFYVFSLIALGGGLRMISHPRPVYAALYFILTILSSSGLYVLLSAEFMAFALVIVYAGAILITYLFVIMLATESPSAEEVEALSEYDRYSREPIAATVAGFVLLGSLVSVMSAGSAGLAGAEGGGGGAGVTVTLGEAPQALPSGRSSDAPPSVLVRVRSDRAVSGRLRATVGGEAVDLDPRTLETGLPVRLRRGETTVGVPMPGGVAGEMAVAFTATEGDADLLAHLPRRVERAVEEARDAEDPRRPVMRQGERVVGMNTAARTITLEDGGGARRTVAYPEGLAATNVEGVAFALLNGHPGSIEIAGVVLLMAMLGAVVLARKKMEMDERAREEAARAAGGEVVA